MTEKEKLVKISVKLAGLSEQIIALQRMVEEMYIEDAEEEEGNDE